MLPTRRAGLNETAHTEPELEQNLDSSFSSESSRVPAQTDRLQTPTTSVSYPNLDETSGIGPSLLDDLTEESTVQCINQSADYTGPKINRTDRTMTTVAQESNSSSASTMVIPESTEVPQESTVSTRVELSGGFTPCQHLRPSSG